MDTNRYIRRCYELAIQAGKKGHDTFGALLVHNGKILEEAENPADYQKGIFGHAEFNLVHQCANQYSDQVFRESVLFTSCAPCERCLGAIPRWGFQRLFAAFHTGCFVSCCLLIMFRSTEKGCLRNWVFE